MPIIREGKAKILVPELRDIVSSDMPVFYNPKMRVNRDLTVLVLKYLCKDRKEVITADPLAASGVRSVRFLLEGSCVQRAYLNDINEKAVESIEENMELNSIGRDRYEISTKEANMFLRYRRGFGFDLLDLDPFGTPVPFLESSMLSLKRGGILSLTATDTAPLAGTYPGTCKRRYGSKPLRNEFKHEVGLRILIKKVIEVAAQYDIAMIPLFGYAHIHYFKLFLKKERGVKRVDELLENVGYLLYCFNCSNRKPVRSIFEVEQRCPYCGTRFNYGGPMWLGKLWDEELVDYIHDLSLGDENISAETKRILGFIKEESELQMVGYYQASHIAKLLKIEQQPPIHRIVESLDGRRTHFAGDGFRTLKPHEEVMSLFKEL